MGNKTETDTKALLMSLFDDGSVLELGTRAGGESGVVTVLGTIGGLRVCAFAQDTGAMGGAFGKAAGEKLAALYAAAAGTGAPVIGIYSSKGARLGEGAEILSAYSRLCDSANRVSGVVPRISVIVGECGGCAAMSAAAADFVITCAGADVFLDRQIRFDCEQISDLHFSTAREAADAAVRLLDYLPSNNLDAVPAFEYSEPAPGLIPDEGSFFEVGPADPAVTGFASVGGQSAGVVTLCGADGLLSAAGARKAARFVRICDAFNIPVITRIDCKGFAKSGCGGELEAAAALTGAYAEATCPKLALIEGSAIGQIYVAAAGKPAGADVVFAYDGAVISPLDVKAAVLVCSPELLDSCGSEAEREAVFAKYAAEKLGARAAEEAGLIDARVDAQNVRSSVISALAAFAGKRVSRLPKKHSSNLF